MKVKIGNKVYDSTKQPILIIFLGNEQELIGNMQQEDKKFCSFPEDSNIDDIKQFMNYENEDPDQAIMSIDEDILTVLSNVGD